MTFINRRRWLQMGGASLLGLTAYSGYRGIRLPTLAWDPRPPQQVFENDDYRLKIDGAIIQSTGSTIRLRAFVPEPLIKLQIKKATNLILQIENVSPKAQVTNISLSETIDGLQRQSPIQVRAGDSIEQQWLLPQANSYRFAAIGDTGGLAELDWCLHRAHQLAADFFILLGDFNYGPGEYDSTLTALNTAKLPTYITIGNHDFHDNGAIFPEFLRRIGPLNYSFTLGKTRFALFDTAANFLPYGAGARGVFFKQLVINASQYTTLGFTHRPLIDPLENSDHDIGSNGERDWLIEQLHKAQIKKLFCGHIHIFAQPEIAGISNIIVGQGLGHQDLLANSINHSKIALGDVNRSGEVNLTYLPLAMPMSLHCHPRTEVVRQSLTGDKYTQLRYTLNKACQIKP